MAFDQKVVGKLAQLFGQFGQQLGTALGGNTFARFEKHALGGFQQLDAKAVRGDGQFDVVLQALEIRQTFQNLLNLVLQFGHVVGANFESGGADAGSGRTGELAGTGGITEVLGDGLLDFLVRAHQPQHDEQGHHSGDEVGVCHFPCAAMVAAVAGAFPFDDDDRTAFRRRLWRCLGLLIHFRSRHYGFRPPNGYFLPEPPPPRQAASIS